jgi:hypothetical protein
LGSNGFLGVQRGINHSTTAAHQVRKAVALSSLTDADRARRIVERRTDGMFPSPRLPQHNPHRCRGHIT